MRKVDPEKESQRERDSDDDTGQRMESIDRTAGGRCRSATRACGCLFPLPDDILASESSAMTAACRVLLIGSATLLGVAEGMEGRGSAEFMESFEGPPAQIGRAHV